VVLDPVMAAKRARLRHVSDGRPGITRHKARHGFDYRVPGTPIRDFATLNRTQISRDSAGMG
jgi:DNA topoisomerase I